MDISIIIVGWNSKPYLEQCLASLAAAPPSRSIEVIIVDNGSTDGTAEMIESRFPAVKLIKSGDNLGFAKANNLAIRQCVGKFISLVNPDVKVLPGCLDALADFLDQNPAVGNVGPRVLNPDGTLQSSCRQFPTFWNNLCSATGLAAVFPKQPMFSGEHMLFFPHDRTLSVNVLVGCFWMIRRDAFDAVGLLDEGFWMYGEDVDWCKRCWRAGWQVVFYPGARAIHDRGTSAAPYPIRFAVAQQRANLYYWSKHHGRLGLLGIKSLLVCHHMLRYLLSSVSRLRHPARDTKAESRKQVSLACLRSVFSRRFSHGA